MSPSRQVLVIGGTRNLGPDLVAALMARGDAVTVLSRGVTGLPPAGVEHLRCDRSDRKAFEAALRGRDFDAVVDTTLYTGLDAVSVREILEGRTGKYVFWSTGQVYLVRTGIRPPYKEEEFDGPVMPRPAPGAKYDLDNWLYGIDKRDAEMALRQGLAVNGFPYVSLRMPMINSARDHYRRLDVYVDRILRGEPVLIPEDQGELRLRHVFGGDVIDATLRSLSDAIAAGTCVNIAQDETLTIEQMLALVAHSLGAGVAFRTVPQSELGAAPWSGRWMSVLDNARARQLGFRFRGPAEYLPPLVEAARRRWKDDAE